MLKLYDQLINDINDLIDLAKKIPSDIKLDKKYIYDVVHLNKEGSILVANEIAKNLENVIKYHYLQNNK
jgi:lysophospholipase L1-like esterase